MSKDTPAPVLQAKNVKKSYGSFEVLKGVDLTVSKGEIVALVGRSGSGKSTFLRCLSFLELPNGGDIELAGMPPISAGQHRYSERELSAFRQKAPMVFQAFNLWSNKTALENVALGPEKVLKIRKSEAASRAAHYLKLVELDGRGSSYPSQLSGGQQQRVAIARALAMEPQVLVMDEPTSALDPELVGNLSRLLKTIAAAGCSMVISTHDTGFAAATASRVVRMSEGQVSTDEACPFARLVAVNN